MMVELPDLANVTHIIQLSLAPVFLLTGIGSLLNVLSARLSRVVDRVRFLEQLGSAGNAVLAARRREEYRMLDRRVSLVSDAIFLFVASAVATATVVAALFIAGLTGWHLADAIALIFILAMLLLVVGLLMFTVEVRVATRAHHVRRELLEE